MANPEHVAKLNEGVEAWNQWRKEVPELTPILRRAELVDVDLAGANLSKVEIIRSNFSGSNLTKADLSQAYIRDTVFRRATFRESHFSAATILNSDLSAANFTGAELSWSHFFKVNLMAADFSEARLYENIFRDTDLRGALGLNTCRHAGPSTLDFRTLGKSGDLPVSFLRGCGLPDKVIDNLPSLASNAIEFYSCFISYSTKDQPFAERLHADLQDKGVRCWFAPHDIQGGKKIHEQIDEAIRMYDRLLLILSEDSLNSSWVETEISKARRRELHEKRRMLFPVRLVNCDRLRQWECFDADTGKDSAREIREYFIPDFTRWKDHDSYREAFERLLRDLKAAAK